MNDSLGNVFKSLRGSDTTMKFEAYARGYEEGKADGRWQGSLIGMAIAVAIMLFVAWVGTL